MVWLLGEYPAMQKKIAVLRYELERAKSISPSEFVLAMTFERGSMDGPRPSGDISDPTFRVAMNYQEKAERLRSEAVKEVLSDLEPLEEAVSRLEYYVSQLDEREAAVLQFIYFQKLPLEEVASKVGVVLRTVRKIRDRAIDDLTELYDLTGRLI